MCSHPICIRQNPTRLTKRLRFKWGRDGDRAFFGASDISLFQRRRPRNALSLPALLLCLGREGRGGRTAPSTKCGCKRGLGTRWDYAVRGKSARLPAPLQALSAGKVGGKRLTFRSILCKQRLGLRTPATGSSSSRSFRGHSPEHFLLGDLASPRSAHFMPAVATAARPEPSPA